MGKRRFEILLPAAFNDGPLVMDACPQCVPDFDQLEIYVTSYPVEVH